MLLELLDAAIHLVGSSTYFCGHQLIAATHRRYLAPRLSAMALLVLAPAAAGTRLVPAHLALAAADHQALPRQAQGDEAGVLGEESAGGEGEWLLPLRRQRLQDLPKHAAVPLHFTVNPLDAALWRKIAPRLAQEFTVVATDTFGLDSSPYTVAVQTGAWLAETGRELGDAGSSAVTYARQCARSRASAMAYTGVPCWRARSAAATPPTTSRSCCTSPRSTP